MAKKGFAYLRRHHVGLLALLVAMSGTAYAASLPRNGVGTAQLKNNAVTSTKVKDHSLFRKDWKAGQLRPGPRGYAGPQGPWGPRGPAGPAGDPRSRREDEAGSFLRPRYHDRGWYDGDGHGNLPSAGARR
jgi:hypothetical protein